MIFLENPLYISWAICVSLLLACCKSPSVRDSVFLPTLQPGVSHPWEHKPGDGDSRSKRKRLCPADSSLPAELARGMQGDLLMWQGKEAHLLPRAKARQGPTEPALQSLLLPAPLQTGSSSLDPVPCGCVSTATAQTAQLCWETAPAVLGATTGPLCPGTNVMLRFQKQLSCEKLSRFTPDIPQCSGKPAFGSPPWSSL